MVSSRQDAAGHAHTYADAAPHIGLSESAERRSSAAGPNGDARASIQSLPAVSSQAPKPFPVTRTLEQGESATDAWLTFLRAHEAVPVRRILYGTIFKRGLDIAGSLLALLLVAPLLLTVALLIKLGQGGPVFYRQQRVGRYGENFTMYKFTSMIPDRRGDRGPAVPWDGIERRKSHKTRTDPRVTKVGRVIRALSIDELPQLFNILKGDMSLIGPRPELPVIVGRYQPWQHQRHLVRPGLTGWWQVTGRSDRPMHEHTDLDLYYIEHLSFGLDLRILARTFRAVLSRSGAF